MSLNILYSGNPMKVKVEGFNPFYGTVSVDGKGNVYLAKFNPQHPGGITHIDPLFIESIDTLTEYEDSLVREFAKRPVYTFKSESKKTQ
ncbi:MAG: hypothetical protein KAS04_07200 [Candidatus Aenigmarchaeota archaeon]|nr:hypothetical protein [Candidatus Aenigmarchaeota archaeon]